MTSDDAKKAAKDIAEGVSDKAGEAGSAAKGAGASVRESAADMAARASDAAADLYDRAQGHVRDAADRLPDGAADALAAGQRAYSRGSDTVARQVSKQPIEALLLAAAIGYLVGWATNRA